MPVKHPTRENTTELPTLIGTLGFSKRRAAAACGLSYHSLLRCLASGRSDSEQGITSWQAELVQAIESCDSIEATRALTHARDLSSGKDTKFLDRYISRRWSDCLTGESVESLSELGDSQEPFDYTISRSDLGDNECLADDLASPDTFRTALIRLHQRCGRRLKVALATLRFGGVQSGYCTEHGVPIARRVASHFGWSFESIDSGDAQASIDGGAADE